MTYSRTTDGLHAQDGALRAIMTYIRCLAAIMSPVLPLFSSSIITLSSTTSVDLGTALFGALSLSINTPQLQRYAPSHITPFPPQHTVTQTSYDVLHTSP